MQDLGFDQNMTAPSFYWAWLEYWLVLCLSCIDDMIIMGKDEAVDMFLAEMWLCS